MATANGVCRTHAGASPRHPPTTISVNRETASVLLSRLLRPGWGLVCWLLAMSLKLGSGANASQTQAMHF